MSKLSIVTCSNFRPEIAAILEQAEYDDVRVVPFAAVCGRPLAGEGPAGAVVDTRLARGEEVAALGAFCLARLARRQTSHLRVHVAHTCMELVAGAPLVELLLAQGAHLMTPGWLANWRHAVAEWGFDQETARAFFGETTRKLILLDTGVRNDSAEQLQAFGDFLGLPVEAIPVGVELLRLLVAKTVLEWRVERRSASFSFTISAHTAAT